MSLSRAQNNLYWQTWARCKKHLALGLTKDEVEAKRHQIHVEALGADKGHLDFTNREFDRVLDVMQSYIIGAPVESRAVNQPIKRAINGILKAGYPEPYIASITLDKFGSENWRGLNEGQLRQLKLTLDSRRRSREHHTHA